MASIHLYWYCENLGMTPAQRDTLAGAIRAWGDRNGDNNPVNRMHWRVRPDENAVIFEAWIEESNLSVLFFRQQLASLFGVSLASVTGSATTNAYGDLATFRYNSTDRLRLGVFGGVGATYEQSRDAAVAFLAANTATWEV